jgi:hypothetical protein
MAIIVIMRLKPSDVVAFGSFLLGGLAYMKVKRKTVAILLFLVGIIFLVASHWSSDNEKKPAISTSTTGDHSPILNASNIQYTDTTIIHKGDSPPLKKIVLQLSVEINQFADNWEKGAVRNEYGLEVLPSGVPVQTEWRWIIYPRLDKVRLRLADQGIRSALLDTTATGNYPPSPKYVRSIADELQRISKGLPDEN